MSRALRSKIAGEIVHVMNRGNNRQVLFECDGDYQYYLGLMKKYKRKHGVLIYHYALMPNHVHLLLEPTKPESVSNFMHDITLGYARRYHQHRGSSGHVWQGRFKSVAIKDDGQYLSCAKYIEMNPVRGSLVVNPFHYPWSSYQINTQPVQNSVLDRHCLFPSLHDFYHDDSTDKNPIAIAPSELTRASSSRTFETSFPPTMSQFTVTQLPKSEVKIAFVVTPEEAKPYLDEAVRELSHANPIPGFRPGKAGYAEIKRAHGEMKIWETALERIVRATYVKTVLGEQIDTIGSPSVNVDRLIPGQDIKFTVIAPVEPHIDKLPDFSACKVAKREGKVTSTEIDKALHQMRAMSRTEILADRAASENDLVIIDLDMKKDRVPLEGGSGTDYRVYLGEEHYIPGFTKELTGIKADEERTFTLPFPSDHFQKHLAGQAIDFTAKAKGVFELRLPEADDAFAKTVGSDTIDDLKKKLENNLLAENKQKADEAMEVEILEKLVAAAGFSEIPDLLVNQEVRRMIAELQQGVEDQNMHWEDYLGSIKKTAEQLQLDFVPQALQRIKTAVLVKTVAKQQDINPSEQEVDAEIDRILNSLRPQDTQARENVSSVDYRDYVAVRLRNRKTMEWLKSQCLE